MKQVGFVAALGSVLVLCGCAGTPARVAGPEGHPAQWGKVVLVETPMRRNDAALAEMFAHKLLHDSPALQRTAEAAASEAGTRALGEVKSALEGEGAEIDDSQAAVRAVEDLGIEDPGTAITNAVIRQLASASGADELVRFRISDYGSTPKAWEDALIAFEVVSTLGIGGIAYSYPRTRPLAGAYLVQEGIEETAETPVEFWALAEICRPVRIEAELVNLKTGMRRVASDTGLSDINLTRVFRHVDRAELDAQLKEATRQAAEKTIADLFRNRHR